MTIGDIIPLFLKLFAQSWGLCFLAVFDFDGTSISKVR